MGDNFWPYGIEANRKALEALLRFSHEQGLAKKSALVAAMRKLLHLVCGVLKHQQPFDPEYGSPT